MKHGTALVEASEVHALNILRLREYSKSKAYTAKNESILWNDIDQKSQVLGMWNRGVLIASMRLEKINSLEELQARMPAPLQLPFKLEFPLGILNKAVTAKGYTGEGLNAHLRYQLLRLAYSQDIKAVLGTLLKGAPRSNSLRQMGYEFFDYPSILQPHIYQSSAPLELVYLNLDLHIKRALGVCATLASESLLLYPYNPLSSLLERSIV